MWHRRTVFARQVQVVFDTLVSAGAFLAALFMRDRLARLEASTSEIAELLRSGLDFLGGVPPGIVAADYKVLMIALVPLWWVSLYYTGAGEYRVRYRAMVGRYARAVLLGLGLFILLTFLFKLEFVARSFVVMFGAVQMVALMLGRLVVVEGVRLMARQNGDRRRILIVGAGEEAVKCSRMLGHQSPLGIQIIGFVSVPGEQGIVEAQPRLGYVGSLSSLLDRLAVDEVVFAVPGNQPDMFKNAIAACDDRGVDVLLTLPPQIPSQGRMEIANVSGFDLPMLGLRRTPKGELSLAVKRLMDLVGGLLGLALAAPVMLTTALAIKLDSKGPILFKQVRAGRNGRKFEMYKFRSMVVDAEAQKAALDHLNEMGGPVFKIRRDPRITKTGSFIRRTSIDELPQLLNIIKGDMSLVGPRPPLPSEVEQYEGWQRRRLSVKPGLTGLWQVSGRNQIDFEEWMALDLSYIDNWSLWLDIKIILRTIPAVVFHRGAS
jgi:exopolysaccharide biosynthesis polyprenyl glycosylphosphotransferase